MFSCWHSFVQPVMGCFLHSRRYLTFSDFAQVTVKLMSTSPSGFVMVGFSGEPVQDNDSFKFCLWWKWNTYYDFWFIGMCNDFEIPSNTAPPPSLNWQSFLAFLITLLTLCHLDRASHVLCHLLIFLLSRGERGDGVEKLRTLFYLPCKFTEKVQSWNKWTQ